MNTDKNAPHKLVSRQIEAQSCQQWQPTTMNTTTTEMTPLQAAKAKLNKLQDWMIEQEDRYHVSGHDLDTWDQLKYLTALVKALEEGLPIPLDATPNPLTENEREQP